MSPFVPGHSVIHHSSRLSWTRSLRTITNRRQCRIRRIRVPPHTLMSTFAFSPLCHLILFPNNISRSQILLQMPHRLNRTFSSSCIFRTLGTSLCTRRSHRQFQETGWTSGMSTIGLRTSWLRHLGSELR